MVRRLVIWPSSEGIEPVRSFIERYSRSRFASWPSSEGICPSTLVLGQIQPPEVGQTPEFGGNRAT